MTLEQELQLFEDVGSIKAGISNLNRLLDAHTTQDMTQFSDMTEAVEAVDAKVTSIIKDLAITDAVRAEHDKHVSTLANRRASIVGSIAGFVSSAFITWIQIHFGGGAR